MSGAVGPAYSHLPVMCAEVVSVLCDAPPGTVVDATLGGGGHAFQILTSDPRLRLVGIDRDRAAVRAATQKLAGFGSRVTIRQSRFDTLAEVLDDLGHDRISGCLFDLGVSSAQIDHPDRGFSYRLDGPLDMRMDATTGPTAADLLNAASEQELAAMLRRNADERHNRLIARAIVARRPFERTTELAQAVAESVPSGARRRAHPARRTFQALRIEVNRELDILDAALTQAVERLAPGGRCAVLSYHSGEDRIVKRTFRRLAGESAPPRPGLPPAPGPSPSARLLNRRPRTPSADEIAANKRAAPARLRAVERLEDA